jgi:hypothetical protein
MNRAGGFDFFGAGYRRRAVSKDEGGRMMTDEHSGQADGGQGEAARDNEENELEAEQESAEAMDAEVPQPPEASGTTEG